MNLMNLKIGQRLGLGFGLMLALLGLVTSAGLASMSSLNDTTDHIVNGNIVRVDSATDMRDAQRRIALGVRDIILMTDTAEMAQVAETIDTASKEYERAAGVLQKMIERPQGKAIMRKIAEARAAAAPPIAKAMELGKENKNEESLALMKAKVVPAVAAWQEAIREMIDFQSSRNGEDQAAGIAQYERARLVMYCVAAFAVLLAIAVAWLATRSITRPIRQAVDIAKTVAAGDLTSHIVVTSTDETGELLAALKEMNGSLQAIVGQVRSGAETMTTATNEIASGNLDLSSRTEQQASALEETASSMEELTTTVKQNAENARQANQMARSAAEVATRGGTVVNNVVAKMGAINESANKIVDIIGVIDSIAFQTNILALNAAVEAARAGEQGRGFAVVASEVRSLAQRSASAAKEIKGLIGDSVEQVGEGSRMVHQAGATMQEIVTSVQRVTDIMAEIMAASQEQESGIEQINQAVGEMDAVTQQNAALVEEAAAAAQSLQLQAGQLEQAVSSFRLTGAAFQAAKPVRATPPSRTLPKAAQPKLAAAGAEWENF
jgi:methyl-accepting chemotaxis protein